MKPRCLNCDAEMTLDHQCQVLGNSETGRTEQLSAKQLSLGQLVAAKYGVLIPSYCEWQEMHPSGVAKVKQIILQLDSQDILILCLVISAQFFPYMGFFLLCFCNNLADCIVLHNKHYLQNVDLFLKS